MRIDILTLFPALCETVLSESIIGRARKNGFVEIHCHDIRANTSDTHRHVDDYPYGGGTGMILQPGPGCECFEAVCGEAGRRPHLVYLSPQGNLFDQQAALRLSKLQNLALLCGHYEGLDERALELIVDEEISVGDFVVTGGELPALLVADAVSRLLPGVLRSEESFMGESHFAGLREYPQYTRPPEFRGKAVPEVLQNGHHARIEQWRREQSLLVTLKKRPDLLEKAALSDEDREFLTRHARREEGE